MTDKEKAIMMAHTGICMLTGDKFQIFHKYIEDIMGRPIMTHEMGFLADEIKDKSTDDFIALCEEESEETRWIKAAYQLPKQYERVLVTTCDSYVEIGYYSGNNLWTVGEGFDYETDEILAWHPIPDAYKESEG